MAGAWRPVAVTQQIAITDGLMRKPCAVEAKKAMRKGDEHALVAVSALDYWVCKATAGQGCAERPLSRRRVSGSIKALLVADAMWRGDGPSEIPAVAGAPDKMEALEWDGASAAVAGDLTSSSPSPKGKARLRRRACEANVQAVLPLMVPTSWRHLVAGVGGGACG